MAACIFSFIFALMPSFLNKHYIVCFSILLLLLSGVSKAHAQTQSPMIDSVWQPVYRDTGYASYYSHKFHGRRTSNGDIYKKNQLTAAHRTLPFGTLLKVTNPKTKRWVIVRINDRGPFNTKRIIDLSYRAAKHLGLVQGKGVMKVYLEEIPRISMESD
jgi:rare lipoprotein A (peptidoglycan hydrolase)